jgi:septal ring factor EnvC (AmiA/AmiB activator)
MTPQGGTAPPICLRNGLRALACGAAIALMAGFATTPAHAQASPALAVERAAQELSEAMHAAGAAQGATDRVAALTRVIRAHEAGLSSLRDSLRGVDIRLNALESRLVRDQGRISQLLGVMAGMERTSGPLIMLHPAGPRGMALAGGLLSSVAPALQAEADALAAELADIKALRAVQQGAADTLARGLRSVQQARIALSRAAADRTDLPRRLTEDPAALRDLMQSVETLDAFAALLQDTRLPPDLRSESFSQAKGALGLPVRGRVLRGFDEPGPDGRRRPGLSIATRPGALVTLPWTATVRYMGPLLNYGNVMVAEPEDDYLLIMTGLGEMFGETGQVLPAGAPIGLMGGTAPDGAESRSPPRGTGGADLTETLYIELREGNRPTDPAPWFEQTRE